eukprot:7573225-Lingulodinium_polyedra.AAC.1
MSRSNCRVAPSAARTLSTTSPLAARFQNVKSSTYALRARPSSAAATARSNGISSKRSTNTAMAHPGSIPL